MTPEKLRYHTVNLNTIFSEWRNLPSYQPGCLTGISHLLPTLTFLSARNVIHGYWIWLVMADCGRSPWYWIGWSVLFALGFAIVFYYHLGPSAFVLDRLCWNLGSMIYYSVVTFTTLGFGDIKPLTNEAAWWVMAEVILGYIMLGGLISILATIIARRS